MTKQRQLVFDPLLNRQPVKRVKPRSDVDGSGCSENVQYSIVLYLFGVYKEDTYDSPPKKRVAVI